MIFWFYKNTNQRKNGGAYYLPCSKKHLQTILIFLEGKKNLNCVDLGSGDGKILLALAKNGYEITGYEINPFLVLLSKIKILLSGNQEKAKVVRETFWEISLSQFDVVIFFGIGYMMDRIEKKALKELKKGAKIISVRFELPNLKPIRAQNNVFMYEIQDEYVIK